MISPKPSLGNQWGFLLLFCFRFWFFWGGGLLTRGWVTQRWLHHWKTLQSHAWGLRKGSSPGEPCAAFRQLHWRVFCPEKLPPGFRKGASCLVSPVASWVCRVSSLPPGGNVQLGGNSYRTAACYRAGEFLRITSSNWHLYRTMYIVYSVFSQVLYRLTFKT